MREGGGTVTLAYCLGWLCTWPKDTQQLCDMVRVTPIFPDSSVWSFLPDDGIRSPAGRCLLTSWGVGEALGVPVPVILEFDTMLW